jgi:hypothetical protein
MVGNFLDSLFISFISTSSRNSFPFCYRHRYNSLHTHTYNRSRMNFHTYSLEYFLPLFR